MFTYSHLNTLIDQSVREWWLSYFIMRNWIQGWLPDCGCINNVFHLARKYARKFVRGRCLFPEEKSFPRAKFEENCELRVTGVYKDKYPSIFSRQVGYYVYCPSNILRSISDLKIEECHSGIPQFWWGHIQPRDALRRILCERKHLMGYNSLSYPCNPYS